MQFVRVWCNIVVIFQAVPLYIGNNSAVFLADAPAAEYLASLELLQWSDIDLEN